MTVTFNPKLSTEIQLIERTGDFSTEPDARTALPPKVRFPYSAIGYAAALADAGAVVVASILGGVAYQLAANGTVGNVGAFAGAGMVAALLYYLIGHSVGFYQMTAIISLRRNVRQIFLLWSLVSLLLALIAFLLKVGADFSRGSIICFALIALVLVLASRRLANRLAVFAVASSYVQGKRVVLISQRNETGDLDDHSLLRRFGLSTVDRFLFSGNANADLSMSQRDLDMLDQAMLAGREKDAHEIVLAVPWSETRKLELVREYLRASPLPVQLLPDQRIRNLTGNAAYRVNSCFSVEVQRGPLTRFEQFSKRVLDVVVASFAIFLLLPLLGATALAVMLDSSGPILFRQRRNGFNRKQFLIYKFRTMTVMEDGDVVSQASRGDLRVTRVGRILRSTSIDELPQLFNVLLGHMSLVGPRPHALVHDSKYDELLTDYAFRNHVKPGITGWAQVNGYRGETTRIEQMKGRVERDLWYINNWDMLLDLKILAMTCLEVVRGRNAY